MRRKHDKLLNILVTKAMKSKQSGHVSLNRFYLLLSAIVMSISKSCKNELKNMDTYQTALLKLYLFYNDYETSYTTYINHARWHGCLNLDGLRVGGNRVPGGNPPV